MSTVESMASTDPGSMANRSATAAHVPLGDGSRADQRRLSVVIRRPLPVVWVPRTTHDTMGKPVGALTRSQGIWKATSRLAVWALCGDQRPERKPVCGSRVRVPCGMTKANVPPVRKYNSTARTTNSVERSRPEAPSPPERSWRGSHSDL